MGFHTRTERAYSHYLSPFWRYASPPAGRRGRKKRRRISMNLETYSISKDESEIQVNITGEGGVKRYEIVTHPIPAGTRALLDKIKLELISTLRISTEEILDPKKMESLQQRFRH